MPAGGPACKVKALRVHAAMAGPSQGLAADARGLVLSEDVVAWADGRDGGAALGLVSRVAGQSDDEALSDSGDDEAR